MKWASCQGTTRRPRYVSPLTPSGPICTHPRPRPNPPTTDKEKIPITNPTAADRRKGVGVRVANPKTRPKHADTG
jgi:hypothetical protein